MRPNSVTPVKELNKLGSLLEKYHGSLYMMLSSIYPEYDWLPWKFEKTPQNYWGDTENQRKYLDWAATQLGIKDPSDWYSVGRKVRKFQE
jgi:hypothetical protein